MVSIAAYICSYDLCRNTVFKKITNQAEGINDRKLRKENGIIWEA
jgi:hypothetical protein